jgi:hypothetical protein
MVNGSLTALVATAIGNSGKTIVVRRDPVVRNSLAVISETDYVCS